MPPTAAVARSIVAVLSPVAIVVVLALLLRSHPEQVELEGIEAPRVPAAEGLEGGEASRVAQAPRRDANAASALATDSAAQPTLRLELVDERAERIQAESASAWAYDERGKELRPEEDVPSVLVWHELAPGRWWILATAPGFEDEVSELEVGQSAERMDRTLALSRKAIVRIALLDPAGSPYDPHRGPRLFAWASRLRPEMSWISRSARAAHLSACLDRGCAKA